MELLYSCPGVTACVELSGMSLIEKRIQTSHESKITTAKKGKFRHLLFLANFVAMRWRRKSGDRGRRFRTFAKPTLRKERYYNAIDFILSKTSLPVDNHWREMLPLNQQK
jgi:hypothetical protein